MKHFIIAVVAPLAIAACSVLGSAAFVSACASPAKNVKTALDIGELACVLIEMNTDAATVAKICNIADQYIPDIEQLLAAKKEAARRLDAKSAASSSAAASAALQGPPKASASAKAK